MVDYLLRRPIFPIVIETDERVYGVLNEHELSQLVDNSKYVKKDSYSVIDSGGEGWSYFAPKNVISPLCVKKKWFKKEIIELFNSSLKKCNIPKRYIASSLSNRTVGKIIGEITEFSNALKSDIETSCLDHPTVMSKRKIYVGTQKNS